MNCPRRRLIVVAGLLAAAGGAGAIIAAARRPPPVVPIPVTPAVVRETWRTTTPHGETDSLAVYRDELEGHYWLFATDKHGDRLQVFDARDGTYLRDLGTSGAGRGEFRRPNGVCVAEPLSKRWDFAVREARDKQLPFTEAQLIKQTEPLLLVVERNGHRLSSFGLPALTPHGNRYYQSAELERPYSVSAGWSSQADSEFVFITDNTRAMGGRVHRFSLSLPFMCGNSGGGRRDMTFGDSGGPGQLRFVESIAYDAPYKRLYICDESPWSRNVKVYSEQGVFSGQTFGEGYITDEPEGIAIWPEGDGGWIILTNQGKELSTFHFFDRRTFAHVGCFIGEPRVANTDGIAVTQGTLGPLAGGALYAVDNDGPVAAYAWNDIARALQLDSVFLKESPAAASQTGVP